MFSEVVQQPDQIKPVFQQAWEIATSEIRRGDPVVITVQHRTRKLEQNAKMWAMLGDIARQVEWYSQYLTSEEWKDVFTAALRKEKVVPGIGGGFVVLGRSTSQMSIKEMADLITLMEAFGAERQVRFTAPKWMRGEG